MAAPAVALKKLKCEYNRLAKEGFPQFVYAAPDPADILTCYYVLQGPPDTPYEGGYFLGKVVFPKEYPFKPPAIYMITPSGRFQPDTRLCLSMSDFHVEQWNPTWTISTILVGILSFMTSSETTTGSVVSSEARKRQLAKLSLSFNLKQPNFCELFPELAASLQEKQNELAQGNPVQPAKHETRTGSCSLLGDVILVLCAAMLAYFASLLLHAHE